MSENKQREVFSSNKLLTPQEVAHILGVSVETLNIWRATKRYPLPYVKAGRLVRYQLADVEAFIASRIMGGEHVHAL